MTEWRILRKELGVVLLAVFLLCGSPVLASAGSVPSGGARHQMITLHQISPQKAKGFLARLRIGTASVLPGTSALLVTAEPGELEKAAALLRIVDSRTEFEVVELGPASAARALPSNERIAQAVGGVAIGTFSRPPTDKTKMQAIVDVHKGSIVAIAPKFQVENIKLAVDLGPEVVVQRRSLAGAPSLAADLGGVRPPTLPNTTWGGSVAETPTSTPHMLGQPDEADLPPEMQERLEEMRRRAAELTRQREAALEQDAEPEGTDQPEALPGPAPAEEPAGLTPGQVVPQEGETAVAESVPEAHEEEPEYAPTDMTGPAVPPASSYQPAELRNGDRTIDLTLPERLPVIQLLDLVGKYLNLDYIYDPAKITGEVTLKLNGNLRGQMKVKDLYLLLESVLKFRGLVMTRHRGNIVTIVPASEALDADPTLVDPDGPGVEAGDVVLTRVFTLQHINTTSADNLLQSMRLSVGTMPIPERSMLIVTAYAHRMERIDQLLQLVDRPGEPRLFRYRQLRYTMAGTLAEKVKALAEQLENVSVTVGEPDTTVNTQKLPTETDAQYRTRLAQIRAAQAAAARARAQAARGQGAAEETKPGVYLDADERTNRILMIGIDEQLEVVEELVDALDVEQQDLRALQLYRMKFVDAEEVARKLAELGVISRVPESSFSTNTRITGGARTAAQQGQGQPRAVPAAAVETAGAEVTEEGLVGEPQVVVVESTNSLLVNATPEQHAQVATIIGYVDSETDLTEIPYQIYQLENSSPEHLSEILENLIQETIEQDNEGKIERTVLSREEKIRIVPDPNTYSLIVYANKKNQEWISNLIGKLDRRRPQVLIDVTLVEITETDSFQYDLNVIKNWDDNGGADPNGGALSRFVEWGSGQLTAFYGDDQIEALLTAMQRKSYGRVLAKPKLLVNDNQEGTISTTDTTYVEVQSAIPVTGGAAGTQENLIQTSTDFQSYEAGIELIIQPHISEGDLLMLNIGLSRSDFLQTVATKPPDTRSNEVLTTVTLPDGSTVILGGLLKMNQTKGTSKVPILGDIPLIGGLFRGIDNEDTQSKLYVFVKAEIIRPADSLHGMKDLEAISNRNRDAFERHELEFQRYQDWPGVEPKPIDPPKVLDAQ